MQPQIAEFRNKGMFQDTSISKSSNEFSYENWNIRITAVNDNTLFSVTNEKGPELINQTIKGTYLGHCVVGEYIVIFTVDAPNNYIYRIKLDDTVEVFELCKSTRLNFNINNPIETLGYYESKDIQKVYWVDGLNQPRVINIITDTPYNNLTQFDFAPTIDKFPSIRVTKEYGGYGQFPAGTIQYFVSYYNKFGSETSIVAATDLQYISLSDRGAKPDETVACNFRLDISDLDNTNYEYLRIYSAKRTSLDGPIQLSIVNDVNIKNTLNITVIDTNDNQEVLDPSLINYIGGTEVIAGTLAQKNDTLFLGDLKLSKNLITPKKILEATDLYTYFTFGIKYVKHPEVSGYWTYENQIDRGSSEFKTFKFGETYRFGIQFQDKKGIWTEPVYIGKDLTCDIAPTISSYNELLLPNLKFDDEAFWDKYHNELNDFTNYRIVMAETSINTRKVLAQGILCPTVFNLQQRINNTPFAIGSWIMRPENGNAHYKHFDDVGSEQDDVDATFTPDNISQEIQGITTRQSPVDTLIEKNLSDKYTNIKFTLILNFVNACSLTFYVEGEKNNKLTELYKYSIKATSKAELKDIFNRHVVNDLHYPDSFKYDVPGSEWITVTGSNRMEYYRITKSASEFTIKEDMNKSNRFYIDRSILTFNSPELENNYSQLNNVENLKLRIVGTANITANYSDAFIETSTSGLSRFSQPVASSLFNIPNISNKTYSLLNGYLFKDATWTKDVEKDIIIPQESTTLYKLYMWNRSGSLNGQPLGAKNLLGEDYSFVTSELKHKIFANKRYSNITNFYSNSLSYDIEPVKIFNSDEVSLLSSKEGNKAINYYGNYDYLIAPSDNSSDKYYPNTKDAAIANYDDEFLLSNSARIKYKETPHAVISLKKINEEIPLLPYLSSVDKEDSVYQLSSVYEGAEDTDMYPWDTDSLTFVNKYITDPDNYNKTHVFIGELYRDTDADLYGGTDKETLKKIKWIPVSKATKIGEIIYPIEGDTYYQRWDCLKAYPFTEEDENSVVDITSVMIESHINLNGRCDVNKENLNITLARPTNYNLFNSSYNQSNNIIKYNILDDKFHLDEFGNQVAWSLSKNPTEDVDTWTNITLANILNLDGSYGKVNKLLNSKDSLIAFQDKAISVINYNERVQISTEQGVPIELANSNKVTGYTKITDNNGCINKWSICKTPSGVYFNDDINKSMMMFNGEGIKNISSLGMSQWFKNNLNSVSWNPINNGFKINYDGITHDLYITNKQNCLLFNEDLQTFTSFMEYKNINFIYNSIKGDSFTSINNANNVAIYKLFEGDYNTTFNKVPIKYSMTYKVNPEPYIDKTFTNIEYISDLLDTNKIDFNNKIIKSPFDKLKVWNEYQTGESILFSSIRPATLKQKFRLWRAEIPRDDNSQFKLDRIRNPWVMLKLSKDSVDKNKMVFHNLLVKYYK